MAIYSINATILSRKWDGGCYEIGNNFIVTSRAAFNIPKQQNIKINSIKITFNCINVYSKEYSSSQTESVISRSTIGTYGNYSMRNIALTNVGDDYTFSNDGSIGTSIINAISSGDTIYITPRNAAGSGSYGALINRGELVEVTLTIDADIETNPTITNLTVNGEYWELDLPVTWRSTLQTGYEFEAYYNNVLVASGSKDDIAQSLTIPKNTYKGTLGSSIRVRVYNDFYGTKYYSEWIEKSFSLKDITATISNLIVDGKYWEKPIELSWQSTDQQQFRVEAWKNNIKEYEQLGTTETRFTIPKNTLTVGEYTFKVWVAYENRFVNSQSSRATLVNVVPSVSNLSLSGSNIDYDLTFSWESLNQSIYELKVTKSDSQVLNYTGTTELFKIFQIGTLITGSTKFEVRVGYVPEVGDTRWSSYQALNIALTESKPSIGVLQPDGQLLDRELPIRVWWTSANQTSWSLTVGSEVSASGTLEKEYIVLGGTLSAGNKTLELTVNYVTAAGVTKTVKKTTKFLIAGKPSAPTFTSSTEFSTNRPLITWDSSEQEGYILNIYNSNSNLVWTTTWISGLVLRQKIFEYLPNGTYKAELQIINALAEKSDVVSYSFKVNATSLTPITLSVINNTYGNELSWNNTDATYLKFYIIRSNKVIAKVDSQTQTSYNDYTCKYGANEYVVRGVSDSDVFTDSNAVSVVNEFNRNTLASVINTSDFIFCDKVREGGTIDVNQNANSQFVHLTGRAYPVMVTSQFSDLYIALNFVNSEIQKLYNFIDSRDVFIYRDTFGNIAYVGIPESRNTRTIVDNQTSITMQLIDYKWEVDYD